MLGHEICGEWLPCVLTVKTERPSTHMQCTDSTSKTPARHQRRHDTEGTKRENILAQ